MHTFDEAQTALFFNQAFFPENTPKLRHRDHLLIAEVLEPRRAATPRIVEFGCGQGNLLHHLLSEGFDANGMEKHEAVVATARQRLATIGRQDRVLTGGVREFARLPPESADLVVVMGVFQYLSDQDYADMMAAAVRVLRPGGCMAATFQNALFDLFTFNKYTIDFFMHQLVGPLLPPEQRGTVEQALASLIVNGDKPAHSPSRARDNIFVRLSNPLTLAAELAPFGLRMQSKHFYEWFGLPPLLGSLDGLAPAVAQRFEVKNASAWQGHFMANAFLGVFDKA
jgi:SAM-dependent methyltransferase